MSVGGKYLRLEYLKWVRGAFLLDDGHVSMDRAGRCSACRESATWEHLHRTRIVFYFI